MAGIYIHIPFCKRACHYCDFHFSTSLKNKDAMLASIKKELKLQNTFFKGLSKSDQIITSIYFGGGTPSLALSSKEIKEIFDLIIANYSVSSNPEITIEANPDDLGYNYLKSIYDAGVNRLSIGVQSFDDTDLLFLNRSHNSAEAINCIKNATDLGFSNLSIDLIYGIQSSDIKIWQNNLEILSQLNVSHLSCYCLTIENKTAFGKWVEEKKIEPVDDENVIQQFNYLTFWAKQNNFEHYEISNFCKAEKYSKHNTSYWKNNAYLGIGPSAHSYDLSRRYWNINNNSIYINSLHENKIPFQSEILSQQNMYNEYIITGLRTKWGIQSSVIESRFNTEIRKHFKKFINQIIKDGNIIQNKEIYTISEKGKLISDKIITSLIINLE